MKKVLNSIIIGIEHFNEWSGRYLALLIVVIMFMILIETILRYFFNSPTVWVWPIALQLFALFVLCGGTYCLLHGSHLKIETLFDRFPPSIKMVCNWIAFICFLFFLGVFTWQCFASGIRSLLANELYGGSFKMPRYPIKLLIAVTSVLFLLQGIVNFVRRGDINKGADEEPKNIS
jgi:TRAP-type mannitol/chloroaromatic compound transport system permease small subunit